MKLYLKNIGKIVLASVEINGITVIAGENDTGKSTVGRTLFAVFNSFYNIDKQINFERRQSVERLINFLIDLVYRDTSNRLIRRFDSEEIAKKIISDIDSYKNNTGLIKEDVINFILQNDDNYREYLNNNTSIDEFISRINEVINVPSVDIFKSVLEKKLEAEFNGQVSNIFSKENGEIKLLIKDQEMDITIENNNVTEIQNKIDLRTEAVYIDDPFVLDEQENAFLRYRPAYADHRSHLRAKLLYNDTDTNVVDEILLNSKFENIYSKISSVCSGDIVRSKRSGLGYKRKNTDKILNVKNLSTGLKAFVMLKMLLLNGTIEYNGTIILDEPEIHLHPEWQLLFAELIVLINKEFSMHILLNTHSPYFLRAIQVYSAKHGVADKCKYYLSEVIDEQAHISDVTNDIDKIYLKLSRPLQKLEDERWQDD